MLIGNPPDSRKILEARRNEPPVAWRLQWNQRPLGWARCTNRTLADQSTEIRGRVHFDELPLGDLTPPWLRAFVRLLDEPRPRMETDVESTLTINPEGVLERIDSSITFVPLQETIAVTGRIEGPELSIRVRSRDLSYQTTVPINPETLLGDTLSPQTQLPGLREGQTWNVEACSPLRYPNRPLEVFRAEVKPPEQISWNGDVVLVWLVEYRTHSGFRMGVEERPRGRLWVRMDGTVLKQEMTLFDSTMTFVRMSDEEAAGWSKTAGSNGPAPP